VAFQHLNHLINIVVITVLLHSDVQPDDSVRPPVVVSSGSFYANSSLSVRYVACDFIIYIFL